MDKTLRLILSALWTLCLGVLQTSGKTCKDPDFGGYRFCIGDCCSDQLDGCCMDTGGNNDDTGVPTFVIVIISVIGGLMVIAILVGIARSCMRSNEEVMVVTTSTVITPFNRQGTRGYSAVPPPPLYER